MSTTSRFSLSFLLLLSSAVSLWAEQFVMKLPFPYGLGLFVFSVTTMVLGWALATNRPAGTVKLVIRVGAGAIVGVLSLFPVGEFFDRKQWPVFHSWGLAHGSFIFVVGWIGLLIYWLMGMLPWLRESAS